MILCNDNEITAQKEIRGNILNHILIIEIVTMQNLSNLLKIPNIEIKTHANLTRD